MAQTTTQLLIYILEAYEQHLAILFDLARLWLKTGTVEFRHNALLFVPSGTISAEELHSQSVSPGACAQHSIYLYYGKVIPTPPIHRHHKIIATFIDLLVWSFSTTLRALPRLELTTQIRTRQVLRGARRVLRGVREGLRGVRG